MFLILHNYPKAPSSTNHPIVLDLHLFLQEHRSKTAT